MEKSSKDELRRLELEEQIQEAVKRSTASLKDFADAQKKVVENYKIMQKINLQLKVVGEEIARLEEEKSAGYEEQVKNLRRQEADLNQNLNLIKETNKELSKGKNLARSVGNELLTWGKGLTSQFIPSLSEVFNTFLKLNDLAMQTSVSIGMSGEGMKLMTGNIEKAQSTWGDLGFDLESSAKMQQSLNEGTGRQVVLSQQAQQTAALTARALNMQSDELGGLIGEMDQFGMGSELAMKSILDMRVQSEQMGVNSGKVIKKFQQNLGLMNKLNFKDGVKGMQKMAILSEKYKIEMSAVAAAADKAFNPEGAIEMAAKLQTLGGSLAGLGDPFQLMYKARNNPEKFMEDITMAAKQSAEFDPKSGDFKVSAYEMDRLRVAAEATGMTMEDLVGTAKQGAKMDYLGDMMKGIDLTPEQKDMLSGMAEITEGGEVLINGKKFSDMSRQDLVKLTERSMELKDLAAQAQSSQAELQGIKNAIMIAFVNFFTENKDTIKGFLTGVKDFIIGVRNFFSPTGLVVTALALYFGPKVLWPIIQGRLFGSSAAATFNAGTIGGGKKGFLGRLGDKVKGLFGGKSSTPEIPGTQKVGEVTSGSDKVGKTGGSGSSLKSLAGGLTAMGTPQVLFGALNLIPTAVGMLTMVAAIPALLFLGMVPLKSLSENLFQMALGLEFMGSPKVLAGAAILSVAAIGFALMTDGAIGLGVIALLGTAAGTGLTGLAVGLTAFGNPATAVAALIGIGLLTLLGGVFIIFAYGVQILAGAIATVVESFTNMFSVISFDNVGALLLLGPALIGVSFGIFALAASLVVLGAAYLMGGFLGLIALEEAATDIQTAFRGVDPQGINTAVNAINSIDIDKLNALKELSLFMSLMGASTTIKFDESLKIDGTIELSGEGGGKSGTDWIKDPVFISKLKQAISDNTDRERNGGRY